MINAMINRISSSWRLQLLRLLRGVISPLHITHRYPLDVTMDRSRKGPKQLPPGYQERRRVAALDRQKNARKEVASRARKLAMAAAESEGSSERATEDTDIQDVSSSAVEPPQPTAAPAAAERTSRVSPRQGAGAGGAGRALRQYYAEQLMQPEWLIEVPPDLGAEWYAMPRPEGRRCLVVAARGQTTARLRNGALFERFSSALPAGGQGTQASSEVFSILDCIYHEPDKTYYVMDLLCWKGYGLYDCASDFRLFWVGTKLAETRAGEPAGSLPHHARRFAPLPAYRCTPEGLTAAHSGAVPFTRDGIYLLHREAHYSAGSTPLALLWKDATCSRYLLDTDAAGVPLPHQVAVLEYRMDGTVATHDDPPAVLGRMPPAFMAQLAGRLRPGRLLRFRIGEGGVFFQEGAPVGADLHYEGPANQRRGRADSLSKIVFQHQARTAPITLQQLLGAAAAAPLPGQEGTMDAELLGMTSTASMSVVVSEGGRGSMQTDDGGVGSGEVEVEMG